LDVKKGDCCLVQCEKHNILIDSGSPEHTQKVISYLENHNVQKLDLAIATHPHDDHIGGFPAILKHFPVDEFLSTETSDACLRSLHVKDQDLLSSVQQILQQKNILSRPTKPGDYFQVGSMNIEILGPLKDYDNGNDSCMVFKLNYGGKTFIFMGDSEYNAVCDLVSNYPAERLKSDVIKIAHHGSIFANTAELLRATKAKYAVISAGSFPNLSYFSSKALEKKLKAFWATTLATYSMGDIVLKVDENGLSLNAHS
jgi:competence protein ComEC